MNRTMSFFLIKCMCVDESSTKCEVKNEIRAIADNYEEFNDMVFELGCRTLADEYLEKERKNKMKKKAADIFTTIIGSLAVICMIFGILFMSRIPEMAIFLLAGGVLGVFTCFMEWKEDNRNDERY